MAAREQEKTAFGAPLRPSLLEDPRQRYAACPDYHKFGPPYSMLRHRAAQRALPNGPRWRIKVVHTTLMPPSG
jgi:hypothetical protein